MAKGITRRASRRLSIQLRGIVVAALAVAFVAIGIAGIARPAPARANTITAVTVSARSRAASAAARAAKIRLTAWRWARKQQGKPYIWGGTGPQGFDCSGLVYAAYRHAGLLLPRTTYGMLSSWQLIPIPKWKARRGDLAFFGAGHVELYGWGNLTFGAADSGSLIGFHLMNAFWYPTMYFRVRI